jgi:hypothetical protein
MKGKGIMKNRSKILMVILPMLACFALLPGARAQCVDGCGSNFNTFQGDGALISTTGTGNTAFGWRSLVSDTDGSFNTAVGGGALALNDGGSNTAVGAGALLLNTTGVENTAVGTDALVFNTIATGSNAVGAFALLNNDSSGSGFASFNNAHGRFAMQANIDGTQNNAFGNEAMFSNTTGNFNTAVGSEALHECIAGSNNTAVGDLALQNSTGDFNTALGANAGTDPGILSNNIYIGDPGFAGDQNVISIGGISASGTPYELTFIGGIYGGQVNTGTALPVYVDTDGHLGTVLVNAKGKPSAAPLRGGRDTQHQVMLNRKVDKLQATTAQQQKQISQQQRQIEVLMAQLKEQAAQIQKVSAQIEVNKPAPQVVVNKP